MTETSATSGPADPRTRFPKISPPEQQQPWPGEQHRMEPVPEIGLGAERTTSDGRLAGRRALITGADSGIGAAVALAFARAGADCAISYLPQEAEDAAPVEAEMRSTGRTVLSIPGDLRDRDFCRSLVQQAVTGLGGLDVLVNIAGRQVAVERIEDLSEDQVRDTFEINVFAMFRLVKAALEHLGPGSAIINTASLEAYQQIPFLLDYAGSKAAINNFSKALAKQLAPRGIRVNVVAPGPTWSALQVSGGFPTGQLPSYGQDTPLGRSGQPIEIAPAYVFLASEEASFVIGETLNVNGGMSTP